MAFLLAFSLVLTAFQSTARDLTLSDLNVTQGAESLRQLASGLIEITAPRLRATDKSYVANTAELSFGFRGRLAGVPLESGQDRVQIGLKLFADNPCNLVYVMWRLFPEEALVVSIKRNPEVLSAQCGNDGYTNIVPNLVPVGASAAVPVPAALSALGGTRRTLRAKYDPRLRILTVRADGQVLWQGRMPENLMAGLRGPAGVRSDNGVFRFRLAAWNYR